MLFNARFLTFFVLTVLMLCACDRSPTAPSEDGRSNFPTPINTGGRYENPTGYISAPNGPVVIEAGSLTIEDVGLYPDRGGVLRGVQTTVFGFWFSVREGTPDPYGQCFSPMVKACDANKNSLGTLWMGTGFSAVCPGEKRYLQNQSVVDLGEPTPPYMAGFCMVFATKNGGSSIVSNKPQSMEQLVMFIPTEWRRE